MLLNMKTGVAIATVIAAFYATDSRAQQPRNVAHFIADGLRALAVAPQTTTAAVRDRGVKL